ncbi:hypothetical protein PIROE2DRAFT_18123, partial [Piromyces sp. E2]
YILGTLLALCQVYAINNNSTQYVNWWRGSIGGIHDYEEKYVHYGDVQRDCNYFRNETLYKYYVQNIGKDGYFKAYLNTRNGVIICDNIYQIPVLFDYHLKYNIEYLRFKQNKTNRNGIFLKTCTRNEHSYLSVKCEKPK